jgi:type VI secretion system protein ImpC
MPPFNFGEIKIAVDGDTSQARPVPETPFRVLLLGDFSGHGRKQPLPARQPTLVDRDNFDDILAALYPELKLRLGDDDLATVQFSALADFHPDRLFECVDMFRKLREMRARLADPATFADAAAELGLPGPAAKPHEAAQATTPQASPFALGSLLDEMIEQTEARAQTRAPAESDLQKFVRRVTEPHLVSVPDPQQPEILGLIDRALGAQMRALLHVPEFQALEAAWRAVFLLVRRIDTDEMLKLYLVDLSKDELAADLKSSSDLRSTSTHRLLAEDAINSFGGEPWAAIVGNYTFAATRAEAELLGRLAKIAPAAAPRSGPQQALLCWAANLFRRRPTPVTGPRPPTARVHPRGPPCERFPKRTQWASPFPVFFFVFPTARKPIPANHFPSKKCPATLNRRTTCG